MKRRSNGQANHGGNACVENLEARLCMDGSVKVALLDGDLVVSGDSEDNQVIITSIDSKTICVMGTDGTKVNGKRSRWFANNFDDLEIRMRQGGEDLVSVQGAMKIAGDLDAELGDGEFVAEGSPGLLEIGEELTVKGGTHCDVTLRNNVIVRGNSSISTGGSTNLAAAQASVPDFASAKFSNPLDIDNPYFPLVPGAKYEYEETSVDDETGETVTQRIVVEVTNQTKLVNGVLNRVVLDRVYEDGLLIEDTVDWHCQDDNGNVWYFGEETIAFEYDDDSNLIDSTIEGSWEAGVDGASPGIAMEAKPSVGDRYYQEFQANGALDFAEVLATNQTVKGPLGTFKSVLRTEDINLREPGALEHKFYAPGIGFIQELAYDRQTGEVEGTLRLISAKLNGTNVKQFVSPTGFEGTNQPGKTTGPVHLFGETVIRSTGPVVLFGVHADDEIEVFGKSSVLVVNSLLDDLTIQAGDSVALWNVSADEELEIRGDVDVAIFGSALRDETNIWLGAGDNELIVKRSTFHDLEADGGRGENAFEDLGRNRFDRLRLSRFGD